MTTYIYIYYIYILYIYYIYILYIYYIYTIYIYTYVKVFFDDLILLFNRLASRASCFFILSQTKKCHSQKIMSEPQALPLSKKGRFSKFHIFKKMGRSQHRNPKNRSLCPFAYPPDKRVHIPLKPGSSEVLIFSKSAENYREFVSVIPLVPGIFF